MINNRNSQDSKLKESLSIKRPWEMTQLEFLEHERGPRKPGVKYFEDYSKEEKEVMIDRFKQEIKDLEKIEYPVKAKFGEETVTILGAVDQFEPYKSEMIKKGGKLDWKQLLIIRSGGERNITFASQLTGIDGKRFITKTPPRRSRGFEDVLTINKHKYIVKEAVSLGLPVPDEVLKEYPDALSKKRSYGMSR